MTFPIPPVAPPTFGSVSPSYAPTGISPVVDTPSTEGTGFTDAISGALNDLNRLEGAVVDAGQQAATGDLASVSDYMIATSEAQLATEITVAIRDRAIAAFNDIMRMQI